MLRKPTTIFLFLAAAGLAAWAVAGVTTTDKGDPGIANKETTSEEPETMTDTTETAVATFGGGCFWGVEAAFRQVKGVAATRVGYAGGTTTKPTYREVCSGNTGHAEVVQVDYDPAIVSYADLLKVFWENHDPTQVNRQGPDIGEQYRSVIFFHTPEQEAEARESKAALASSGQYKRPIATRIEPAPVFWPAEEYHQQYLEKRGLSSCGFK